MDTKPDRQTFPMRNRIISGWGFGLLVVEAGINSGALISASQAADQGRNLYAVPGPIDRPTSHGTNRLIQQGAKLVMSVDDILEDVQRLFPKAPELLPSKPPDIQGDLLKVYDAISSRETSIDEIIQRSGIGASSAVGRIASTGDAAPRQAIARQVFRQVAVTHFCLLLARLPSTFPAFEITNAAAPGRAYTFWKWEKRWSLQKNRVWLRMWSVLWVNSRSTATTSKTRAMSVSSAIGHLVELCMPGELDKKRGKWSFQNLPIIPEQFELKPIEKTESRFKLLKRLMKRDDIDLVINACDAGREGELIFRYLVRLAGIQQAVQTSLAAVHDSAGDQIRV